MLIHTIQGFRFLITTTEAQGTGRAGMLPASALGLDCKEEAGRTNLHLRFVRRCTHKNTCRYKYVHARTHTHIYRLLCIYTHVYSVKIPKALHCCCQSCAQSTKLAQAQTHAGYKHRIGQYISQSSWKRACELITVFLWLLRGICHSKSLLWATC